MKRVCVVHEEWGLFVGESLGFVFFSEQEDAGQWSVAVFEDAADAADYMIIRCKFQNRGFRYVEVDVPNRNEGAYPQQLRAAGLEKYVGKLEANWLQYGETRGTA